MDFNTGANSSTKAATVLRWNLGKKLSNEWLCIDLVNSRKQDTGEEHATKIASDG